VLLTGSTSWIEGMALYNDESASDESIEKVNEPEGGFGVGRERR
jgi:hypothetical protein